jgi:hypothetical protein
MPALSDVTGLDMSKYEHVDAPIRTPQASSPSSDLEPGYNVFLRCPLPPIWSAQSDSLRQFYRASLVPQVRLFAPTASQNGGGNTTVNSFASSSSSGGGGGGSSTTTLAIAQTSINTPALAPSGQFVGSLNLSKVFQLLSVGTSAPARIRLYGTAAAQAGDAGRGLDVPLPAGSTQNVICDVALDTSPFLWSFQDRVGANNDSPVTSTIYITITNLDTTTDTIRTSINYVPVVN